MMIRIMVPSLHRLRCQLGPQEGFEVAHVWNEDESRRAVTVADEEGLGREILRRRAHGVNIVP
jgi:hypothetical protein